MFLDRADAARRLANELRAFDLREPLVLGIPRGGVVTGVTLAQALGAEFDVVLAHKLGSPNNPELAFGAIGEDGEIYLDPNVVAIEGVSDSYLQQECKRQMAQIERRKEMYRPIRPAAKMAGRSVILTDDGIATGSTIIAALHVVRSKKPYELIVAVPVAPAGRIPSLRRLCDRFVCLLAPSDFWAVGQFYSSFSPVEDSEVLQFLRESAPRKPARNA